MSELRWVESGSSAIALDATWYPVLFTTWFGTANDRTIREYFDWTNAQLRRIEKEQRAYSMIVDADSADRPAPQIRSLLAELTAEQTRVHAAARAMRVGTFVVMTNPMLRGALTAIQWLTASRIETEYAPSCAQAITLTEERLVARGSALPTGLSSAAYRRPRRDGRAVSAR